MITESEIEMNKSIDSTRIRRNYTKVVEEVKNSEYRFIVKYKDTVDFVAVEYSLFKEFLK